MLKQLLARTHDMIQLALYIYQNVADSQVSQETHAAAIAPENRKRRRAYDAISSEIVSYPKKPKMVEIRLANDNEHRQPIPTNLSFIKQIDLIWMLSML